jgi:hypothetical protein
MTGIFDSLDPIDALILSVGLGKGSAALTLVEQKTYDSLRLTAPASAGLFFDLYPRAGQKKIGLDGGAGYAVTVRCGTAVFPLNPGRRGLFLQDGTPDGLSKAQAFGGGSLVLPTLSLANGKYPILSKSLKDGNQPLSKADRKRAQIVRLTGADGSGGSRQHADARAMPGTVVIGSEPGNSAIVHVVQGTADFEVEPGRGGPLHQRCDRERVEPAIDRLGAGRCGQPDLADRQRRSHRAERRSAGPGQQWRILRLDLVAQSLRRRLVRCHQHAQHAHGASRDRGAEREDDLRRGR